MRRLEALRIEAGACMGIADAGNKVIPKPVLLSAPQQTAICRCAISCRTNATALAITGRPGHRRHAGHAGPHFGRRRSVPGSIPSNIRVGPWRGPQSQLGRFAGDCQRGPHRTPLVRGRVYDSPAPATASATQARQWTSAA